MAQITGLQAHTTYVARAYAVNRTGTGYGSSVVFTTEDLKVPQLLCSASDSTSTSSSIQAEATLTSNGGFAVTAYGFCWSTESATPTVDNLRQEVGTGEIASFQALLANLEPATTYYLAGLRRQRAWHGLQQHRHCADHRASDGLPLAAPSSPS